MNAKPNQPWHYGETGITGEEHDELLQLDPVPIEEMFPLDDSGSRLSLGNSIARNYERMPPGVITIRRGYVEDPPVSMAQNRAMRAAAAGHSTLGIPQSVGEEFSKSTHGHKLGNLPEHVHHKK